MLKRHVEVHLVHEHARAGGAGDLADPAEGVVAGKHPGRVVQVSDDNEAGARRDAALDFFRIEAEAILEAAFEVVDLEAEEARGAVEQPVPRAACR